MAIVGDDMMTILFFLIAGVNFETNISTQADIQVIDHANAIVQFDGSFIVTQYGHGAFHFSKDGGLINVIAEPDQAGSLGSVRVIGPTVWTGLNYIVTDWYSGLSLVYDYDGNFMFTEPQAWEWLYFIDGMIYAGETAERNIRTRSGQPDYGYSCIIPLKVGKSELDYQGSFHNRSESVYTSKGAFYLVSMAKADGKVFVANQAEPKLYAYDQAFALMEEIPLDLPDFTPYTASNKARKSLSGRQVLLRQQYQYGCIQRLFEYDSNTLGVVYSPGDPDQESGLVDIKVALVRKGTWSVERVIDFTDHIFLGFHSGEAYMLEAIDETGTREYIFKRASL